MRKRVRKEADPTCGATTTLVSESSSSDGSMG
jgi:hypothetical protein